ncbi:MAG: RibD family protein [Rikenellaceae bacterium]|nr:RibD family protein [Rikenellaceae bacterium]MCL2692174.1 RibD family protein [Rikenellaceae bacterium]
MEIILSAAVSLDGYLDDCSPQRLKLSSAEDWAAVQRLRATCDAILVGAETVRRDNPSLVIRDEQDRRARADSGMDADIVKVVVTASGNLDPDAAFFRDDAGHKIVFATRRLPHLEPLAEVIVSEHITAASIAAALSKKGFRRLLVEGGQKIHTMFLSEGVGDRLRLAVAPFFVGEPGAPRLVGSANFAWNKNRRMALESVEMLGDTAVMNYALRRHSE